MQWKNTIDSYGLTSKLFHWLMFILLLGAVIGGNIDSSMPDGPEKGEALALHKSFGLLILALGLSRLGWRLLNPQPQPVAGISPGQARLAGIAHWLLYGLFLAQPLSGILMSQSAGYPVPFFGLFEFPTLVQENESLAGVFHECHEYIWLLLALLVLGHTAMALKHHFMTKNNVLRRMWNS